MAEWNATYIIYVPITASTENAANKRMLEVHEMLQIIIPDNRKRPWLGDIEFGEMTLEEN